MKWPQRAFHALALTVAAMALAGITGAAQAESGKLGVYSGTVIISGTEIGQENVTFRASVKMSLPLTDGSKSSAIAEVNDFEKPSATAVISQWDVVGKNASADSDGKFTSWTCSLAAPTEVPMNGQGVLNLNYRAKTHSMFIALVATKPVPLKCVNSRSGAYNKDQLVSLFFGTNEPDVQPWKELPFADATRLTAKFKLMPVSHMKDSNGPLDQEWDLKLTR